MGTNEFTDIEKQLAKEIFNGIKKDYFNWASKIYDDIKLIKNFNHLPMNIKIGYFFIARYVLERLEKEI